MGPTRWSSDYSAGQSSVEVCDKSLVIGMRVNQASVTPRQRSTSGSAFPQPREMPYRYPTQLAQGPNHATHRDGRHWQPGQYDNTQRAGQSGDWRGDSRNKSPETRGRHRPIQNSAVVNSPPKTSVVADTRPRTSLDWGSSKAQENDHEDTSGRRPTKASTSDRSEATASSQSDASSPRSMAEDLRGLSLGDHVSSQLIPLHGSSPRNQRWDPILGDVQRNHDTLVVGLIVSCSDKRDN